MSITKKSPTVQTRLQSKDYQRLVSRAKADRMSQSALLRKAALAYLDVDDPEKKAEQDRVIAKLEAVADRLAAMNTNVHNDVRGTQLDVQILYLFLADWIKDEDLLRHYKELAPKRIKERRAKYRERKQRSSDDT